MKLIPREEFAALPLAQRLQYLQNPFIFMAYCVATRDETNTLSPVRPAPVWPGVPGYKPYIETITNIWMREPLLIVDKARRLWISYLMLTLHLHQAFTGTDRRIGIISKKFDDAAQHLLNMQRIYEAIPEDIYPAATRPTLKIREGMISFPEVDSMIHAVASGPDQVRQYGFSSIFWDEMDFCDDLELTYGALLPTIANGGKLTIATTHAMVDTGLDSFYRLLLEDRL